MSKEVIDRESLARDIIAAAETHAPGISQVFKARFAPYATEAEKKKLPDLGLAVLLCARAVGEKRDEFIAKSEAHAKELSDDDAPRKARDSAKTELVAHLVSIRGSVDNVYGAAGLKALGLEGRTPTDPKPVLDHARRLAGRLQDKKLVWPAVIHEGVIIDKAVWIAKLLPIIQRLDEALKAVAVEEREAQVTSDAKNRALRELDEVLDPAGDLIGTGLELIGRQDLAERIWPTVRRSRGASASDGGTEPEPPVGG
jgi:hypothetical protein